MIRENRLYPLDQIGWEYYDGQYPLFEPDDGLSPEDLQKAVTKIMSKFYHFRNFIKLSKNIVFNFPRVMFFPTFTILTGKVRYITVAFRKWNKNYYRNYLLRFGGYLIVRKWLRQFKSSDFLERLERSKIHIRQSRNSFE